MKPTIAFTERLRQGTLLADGAMGTMLHHAGEPLNACFDELNMSDPERVTRIHEAFIEAGAELIETNTFSANRFKLLEHGLADQVAAINAAAVGLARDAVQRSEKAVYVGGSVGPTGARMAPYGRVQPEQVFEVFREQLAAQAAAGVDVFVLETFTDLDEIQQAIKAARAVAPSIPIIASMTFTRDDRTVLGDAPREVANTLAEVGADVIGVNCSGGPSQLARIAQIMRTVEPDVPISAMPNAGFPETVGGRVMYPATPEYFGDYAIAFRDFGVTVIGGCCGTMPQHIHEMRKALDAPNRTQSLVVPLPLQNGHDLAVAVEQPTELARKLEAGKFVVTVEMAPPRSFTAQKVIASAQLLQESGVDMINVSDSPMARMRMSPWAVCHLIQDRLNMETVLHFPTRGRNLLRVQGDLLAAHALNVRNIFVVMGDPTHIGDYPNANDNYDVVPSGLIKLIKQGLNAGKDQAGNSIGQPTRFLVGCALNIVAQDLDAEIKTLRKKIEAGADFALTQTVFDAAHVETFRKRYEQVYSEPLKLALLVGVLPLYGARHAAFLHNEVPGIVIPEATMNRINVAGETAPQTGVAIAQELLRDLRGLAQGAYLIPPFGKYEMAAEIMDGIRQPA
ncbi:MAG TPA: bifunctional homocysteine S-methyltransferase/methylenetetrahydrofolate reductase [Aggregatilineales bacterium]|nr:bifunctional homocysteine S-methyltransferase/methylenetetrahydrofolate reductase [Aggregatilineales bacterium]